MLISEKSKTFIALWSTPSNLPQSIINWLNLENSNKFACFKGVPEGVKYINYLLILLGYSIESKAFSTTSARIIMPGPPPKGSSSILLVLS